MTVTIKITNEGPHDAGVMYYDEARKLKAHSDTLAPGQSIVVNVWDGHLPVLLPCAPATGDAHLFRSPPASSAPREG